MRHRADANAAPGADPGGKHARRAFRCPHRRRRYLRDRGRLLPSGTLSIPGATRSWKGRGDLGGTWGLFRYPGVRSDSDMFTLGYSFRPWNQAGAIADGAGLLELPAGDRPGVRHRPPYPLPASSPVRGSWSSGPARWTIEAGIGEGRRAGPMYDLRFPVSCAAATTTMNRATCRLRRPRGLPGAAGPSAALARGPRLPPAVRMW